MNQQHEELQQYRAYITKNKRETPGMARKGEDGDVGDASEVSQSALYRVSGFLKGLFMAMGCDPEKLYSLPDARRVLQDYLKDRALACTDHPQNVVGVGEMGE